MATIMATQSREHLPAIPQARVLLIIMEYPLARQLAMKQQIRPQLTQAEMAFIKIRCFLPMRHQQLLSQIFGQTKWAEILHLQYPGPPKHGRVWIFTITK